MVKSLVAFGWLRDFVIVLLLLVGNDLRHSSPLVATVVLLSAVVVFLERFLWSWYLCDLRDQEKAS
jgi:hypothetical protein